MGVDEELTKKIESYQNLAKENPNVDVGMLILNALQNEKKNQVSAKSKHWAYMISISVPPFGLLFALKYFAFSDKDDAQEVAWSCVILTVLCLAMYWILGKVLLSGSGTSLQQIQQIKPSDVMQLTQ